MVWHTFLIGAFNDNIIKDIQPVTAETQIQAKNAYTSKFGVNIVCIGEIIDGMTYIITDYLKYIDWGVEALRNLTPPVTWVNKLPSPQLTKYIVGLVTGGVMEQPTTDLYDFNIIPASSKYEAKKKYDDINNCSYYYGRCIGEITADNKACIYKESIKDIDNINLKELNEAIQQHDSTIKGVLLQ